MGSRQHNSRSTSIKDSHHGTKYKKAGLIRNGAKYRHMTEEFSYRWYADFAEDPTRSDLSETETTIRFCSHRFNFWKLNKGKLRGLFVPCNITSISERKV